MRRFSVSVGVPISIPRPDSSRPPPRLWVYRVLATVAIPALLLLGLEGGLRLAGYGRSAKFLIPDDQAGSYRTNPDFVSLFMPGSFDLRPLNIRMVARKPANTVRIVVLGESAAQGIPAPAFGFAPQLQAQLRTRYPDKNIEVINTGVVAINSHVVYQIARDLADFSPDLFVVYLGNNEVVGPYGPGCAYLSAMPPLPVIRLSVFIRSTRTGQLIGALLAKINRHGPAAEWGGMSMFVDNAVAGDDPRLEAVYRNFEANLQDIVRVATGVGAKTLLCTVVSNLKDCAPLLSRHRAGLSSDKLAAWQRAFDRGRLAWRLGEVAAARTDLQEARRLDPQYADTLFMLGSLELQASKMEAARSLLLEAEHWDALRFRPDPRINDSIRQVARATPAVSLLDAAVQMGSDPASTVVPAGRELLFEHVHLDWDGNFLLARAMAQGAESALFGAVASPRPWLESADCAAALAYSPHEHYPVLQHLATIVQNPPFTNQLTYIEDMARLARDLTRTQTESVMPGNLQQAKEMVRAASVRDPKNPDLAKLEEGIDDDLGDMAGALAAARRSQQLQPVNFVLVADEAIKLSRLGRFEEAEVLLKKAAATCPPRDLALMAPAFADFFIRTKRLVEGRRHLDGVIALRPADASLRLLRGRLTRLAGDATAAENEFRAILADKPGNQGALEALVSLLMETGRPADAEQASLAAADRQPGNLANNLRAAILSEARGDDARTIRFLLAAERSGPVTPAVELRLARKLFSLGKTEESLLHLAEAKRIVGLEDDAATTEGINQVIADVRAQTH